MPTFALITPGGSALGPLEFDDNETQEGAIISREGESDRRVVGRLGSGGFSETFAVLVVERVNEGG